MFRRTFDAPPLTRFLQAAVIIAFATGLMALAMHTDNGAPRMAIELSGANVMVAP